MKMSPTYVLLVGAVLAAGVPGCDAREHSAPHGDQKQQAEPAEYQPVPDHKAVLQISGESIHSMPTNLEPGDRVDLIATFADDLSHSDEPTAVRMLQRVLVLEVDDRRDTNSLSVAVADPEPGELIAAQNDATFTVVTRHPDNDDRYTAGGYTLSKAFDDLDDFARDRSERAEPPPPTVPPSPCAPDEQYDPDTEECEQSIRIMTD